ncbi:Vacuolar protein sorting-associated protein 13 C-terminal, partial [Trinorchestia longiramus]
VLSQFYVVVLGLDLLGNPLSFVVGLSKGMGDLFYEPILGAVEGPGEFAEGLVLGARSFVSKTVGGLAGVASRITGTIGKGVASLTLDEEYQKRRREQQLNRPADGLETMARGVRGLGT